MKHWILAVAVSGLFVDSAPSIAQSPDIIDREGTVSAKCGSSIYEKHYMGNGSSRLARSSYELRIGNNKDHSAKVKVRVQISVPFQSTRFQEFEALVASNHISDRHAVNCAPNEVPSIEQVWFDGEVCVESVPPPPSSANPVVHTTPRLAAVKKGSTTQLSTLTRESRFRTFDVTTVTGLGASNSNWSFFMADMDRDGRDDLVGINRQGQTMTELHTYTGASNFSDVKQHVTTGLSKTSTNWDFDLVDWDRDGRLDLACINRHPNQPIQVFVLTAASNYQHFIVREMGRLIPDNNWMFLMADWDSDGTPDLICINRQGLQKTHVKVFSGAGPIRFSRVLLDSPTNLHKTSTSWTFKVTDWNQDGIQDILAINQTPNHNASWFALDGRDRLRSFNESGDTGLLIGESEDWALMPTR